jgi:hypothetical protein
VIPHSDWWLIAGIVAFYLYDAATLVYANETLLVRIWGKWTTKTLRSDWLLSGKNLYFPNPLTPAWPFFAASWSETTSDEYLDDRESLARMLVKLQPLQILVSLQAILMLVLLPFVLLRFGHGAMLLAAIGAIYSIALLAVSYVYWHREAMGVNAKQVRSMAFDAIACPPFSINLVRKICLARGLHGDVLQVGKRVLTVDELLKLAGDVSQKVEADLAVEDEESSRYQRLVDVQERIREIYI